MPGSVALAALDNLPNHVAIIMDGNGRWGTKRGIGRLEGHRRGVDRVRTIVGECLRTKISYLTLFAFSSENWTRPPQEVEWLMRLLSNALDKEVQELDEQDVQLKFIGELNGLPPLIQKKIKEKMQLTKGNSTLVLTIALNYGGRWDLMQCCQKIVKLVQQQKLTVDEINADVIQQQLSTGSLPEPDLFIRTGGEMRMSNFLLWQLAYTELYFTDVQWPDFDREQFYAALYAYSKRVRRFGGIVTHT